MIAGLEPATWAALIAGCEQAWPHEACGWIGGDGAVRPAAVGDRTSFAFADDDLLALAAAYRSGVPPRLLYHSHPCGPATMSAADREALALHPLPHLVIAVRAGRAVAATLYRWLDGTPLIAAAVQRDGAGRWTATEAAA